jgi:putative tryptophan/tyrosine transport system substrate-binding protein
MIGPTFSSPRRSPFAGRKPRVAGHTSRREFVALLGGGAATLSFASHAQQMPIVGVLRGAPPSAKLAATMDNALRAGLGKVGFVEGRNVVIEIRSAEGDYARLPALAAELVARNVDVIYAEAPFPVIKAAKSATTTIPIVFVGGIDPVATGLVSSLAHPGGNVTGFTVFGRQLQAKRLEILADLAPQLQSVAYLSNPANPMMPTTVEQIASDIQEVARTKGLSLQALPARNESEIDAAFATLGKLQSVGLLVGVDALFGARREQLVALATRYAIPTMYFAREFADVGGLISYGPDISASVREAGVYVGRILEGEKPAELPVQQPAKFELIINVISAKAIGLTIPQSFYAVADEVIE